jgi:hypothetical protein
MQILPSSRKRAKAGPALQHVVDGFGEVVMPRERGTLLAHPGRKLGDEGRDMATALVEPPLGRKPVERPLDLEDQVDAAHCLTRQWRPGGLLFLRSCFGPLAMSARTKNLRRPWLQHAASVIGPGRRAGS